MEKVSLASRNSNDRGPWRNAHRLSDRPRPNWQLTERKRTSLGVERFGSSYPYSPVDVTCLYRTYVDWDCGLIMYSLNYRYLVFSIRVSYHVSYNGKHLVSSSLPRIDPLA